jgi:hypothetical protein
MDEGMAAVANVLALEDVGRGLAAEIAVDAIFHDEELPWNIFRDFLNRCKRQACHEATCCLTSGREIRRGSQIQRGIRAKCPQENA